MMDKNYRSLAKAISYRITGTLYTILLTLLITGKLRWALSVGFGELFGKVVIYYLHERAWERISFGRKAIREDFQI